MANRDDWLFTEIGHYTLIKKVGEGAFALVYQAKHKDYDKYVFSFRLK